jgi:REP element-mobilizing transposase RayT
MAVRNKTEFEAKKIYFITFTVCEWQKIFTSQKYFDLFYNWFDYQREHYQNRIHGYVIMPNHFHGLLYINPESPSMQQMRMSSTPLCLISFSVLSQNLAPSFSPIHMPRISFIP